MSEDQPNRPPDDPQAEPGPEGEPSSSEWRHAWLIPGGTFLVGLLLGSVVVGLLTAGDDASASLDGTRVPVPSATSTPTPGESTAAPITIPGECVQIAEDTQDLLSLLDDAVSAVGELDAQKLSSIVAELDTEQQALRAQAAVCQGAAAASASASPGP